MIKYYYGLMPYLPINWLHLCWSALQIIQMWIIHNYSVDKLL